jgi:hypothetical protein
VSSFTEFRRGLQLALSMNRRSPVKFALLTILVAMSTLVFLGVSELSRASTDSLDSAIESDLGVAGTYRVEASNDLGLTLSETLAVLRPPIDQVSDQPVVVAERFPSIHPECPPFNLLGDVTAIVLRDDTGAPEPFAPGKLPADGDLCLAGLAVPRDALREATAHEKDTYDASIVVDPVYEQVLRLASDRPPTYLIAVTTGENDDVTDQLRTSSIDALREHAQQASVPATDAVVVTRADSGGSVRSASAGIRLVYGLIGWGVLLISGIGLLVAELIVLRDRTWFFGLARAVGARRWSIAWLVIADILLVLIAGLLVAITVLAIAGPGIASFGREAFQVELHVLRLSALPQLFLGFCVVLLLAGFYPAIQAMRLDPLDVLERR